MLVLILGEHPQNIIIQSTTLTFPGPPSRDYPYTTVPNQVHRIFRAQQLHDKKHYDERVSATPEARAKLPYIDYLRPIIADADMGLVLYRCHHEFYLIQLP